MLAQVRRGIDLRASQEGQAPPDFWIHQPGRIDIGGRNQAQPHRLRRYIRQRTVHREENRRKKSRQKDRLPKRKRRDSHPSLIKRRLRPSFLLLTGCVHPFIVLRFRLSVIHIPLYAHDNRLYHISFIRQSPVRFLRRNWRWQGKHQGTLRSKALPNSPYGHHPPMPQENRSGRPASPVKAGKSHSTSLTFKLKRKWKRTLRKFQLTHCLIWCIVLDGFVTFAPCLGYY